MPRGHRFVVIGDLHGDYTAVESVLRTTFPANQPDEDSARIHAIFLGDLLDRGARDFQVLHLVAHLRHLLGERLTVLRGNHEEWTVSDDGRVRAAAAGEVSESFLPYYRRFLPEAFFERLARHFEALPHLLVLEHRTGNRIVFLHGGVPQRFLMERYELEEVPRVRNLRRALLWGRRCEIAGKARPARPYPYDLFFPEDVLDFCERFGVRWIVRGHDPQRRGLTVDLDGRLLTLHSTGRPPRAPNPDTKFEVIELPRYLVIETDGLFENVRVQGESAGVDRAVAVNEVFQRDVVFLLDVGSPAEAAHFGEVAELIREALSEGLDAPVHLFSRPGYTHAQAEPRGILEPGHDVFDSELDPNPRWRLVFVMGRDQTGALTFQERASHVVRLEEPRSLRLGPDDDLREFVRQCAELVLRVKD